MAVVFDGKKESERIKRRLATWVAGLKAERGGLPRLVSVLVGDDPASRLYSRLKKEFARQIGVRFEVLQFEDMSAKKVISRIVELSKDDTVGGVMIQLPLPPSWSEKERFLAVEAIAPEKDVDGLTSFSLGRLAAGRPLFLPAVVKAGRLALRKAGLTQKSMIGKNACVIGNSPLVGKPFALLLTDMGATVTLCHRGTSRLEEHTRAADILVSATGRAGLVKGSMVRKGAVVIDVGAPDGDVEFASVAKKAAFITPVPGGVGPLTVACLLESFVEAVASPSHFLL